MGKPLIDRLGHRYERLLVIARAANSDNPKDTNARWFCKCDCGNVTIAYGQDLAKGKVKSCGCLNAERIIKHGLARTAEYNVWKGMMHRCYTPSYYAYKWYGGRGITVDPAWHDVATFLKDMGGVPSGRSIDRINNDGPYSKENCRWATQAQQHNNRRSNRRIEAFGKTQTVTQWAREYDIPPPVLFDRLRSWPIEKALTTPYRKRQFKTERN